MPSHRPMRLGTRVRAQVPPARTALYSAIEQELQAAAIVCSTGTPGTRGLRHAALGVALSLAVLAPAQTLHAATLTVDLASDTVADDGACALREAVDNANADSAVHDDCAAGSGLDTIVFDGAMVGSTVTLAAQLTVTDALALDGPGRDALTIDQNGSGRHIYASAPLSVEGLTFFGGNADIGGAIHAGSDLTVTASRFKYNSANFGGALAHGGNAPAAWEIQDTQFQNNRAEQPVGGPPAFGGAVLFAPKYQGSSLTIDGSSFEHNEAGAGGTTGLGGALLVVSDALQGSVTITNSEFNYNTATAAGGALLSAATVTVAGSRFAGNEASELAGGAAILPGKYTSPAGGSAAKGAGMYGSADLSDTVFYNNLARASGGALISTGAIAASGLTVTRNHTALAVGVPVAKGGLSCNRYGSDAGGIAFEATQSLVVTASTFSDNCAGGNGGGATITLRYSASGSVGADNRFEANVAYNGQAGLGVYLGQESSITIAGTFSGNRAYDEGGGLGVVLRGPATALIDGAQVTGNDGYSQGGGISIGAYAQYGQVSGAQVTVVNSTVTGNSADDGAGIRFRGNGLYYSYPYVHVARPSLTISASTITANDARWGGGGIKLEGQYFGTVLVDGSTIQGNSSPYGRGGGLALELGNGGADAITLSASTISGNSARTGGGLYLEARYATVAIVNSTVHGNQTAPPPFAKGLTPDGSGGGIAVVDGAVDLDLVTLTGNTAATSGGGLAVVAGGSATLRNSIVADNSAGTTGPDIFGPVQADFTLVEDPSGAIITGANNQTGIDPLLGPLADNGGPTLTRLPQPGSPVIDTGDPAFTPPPATDQRGPGFARVLQVVDKGAVELQLPSVLALTISPDPFAEGAGSVLTVQLDAATGADAYVTVEFSGAAVLGTDFTAEDDDAGSAGIQVLVPAGSSSGTITLSAIADGVDEPDEGLTATATAASGATLAGTVADSATITDGDTPTVTLSLGQSTLAEEGGSTEVIATLSQVAATDVLVTLALSGTAGNGVDYGIGDDDAAAGVQILIPAGSLTGAVTLTAIDDTAAEGNETVVIEIASVSGAAESGVQQVTASIDDSADLAGGGTGNPPPNPTPELIPTLSEWMLMLLGLLLPAAAVARLRGERDRARRRV